MGSCKIVLHVYFFTNFPLYLCRFSFPLMWLCQEDQCRSATRCYSRIKATLNSNLPQTFQSRNSYQRTLCTHTRSIEVWLICIWQISNGIANRMSWTLSFNLPTNHFRIIKDALKQHQVHNQSASCSSSAWKEAGKDSQQEPCLSQAYLLGIRDRRRRCTVSNLSKQRAIPIEQVLYMERYQPQGRPTT